MYDYFYENQSEQYLFLQLPLMLIKDDQFKRLTDSSKILYSLLLNRTILSSKNGWRDEQGRVYIIFTIEEIMEDLNCAKEKATKSMKELKEIGLIETVRRGLGLPNLIFVKNFATSLKYAPINLQTPVITQKFDNRTSRISNTELKDGSVSELQEFWKSNASNIDRNNNYSIDTESESMSTSDGAGNNKNDRTLTMTPDVIERQNEKGLSQTALAATANSLQSPHSASSPTYNYNTYRHIIQENIDYSHYIAHRPSELDLVDELVECMLDVICTGGDTVKIGGEEKNRQMVISQYMKITSEEIDHILTKFKEQHHRITHTNSYLKTMLYTIRQEIGHYHNNAVRADGVVW